MISFNTIRFFVLMAALSWSAVSAQVQLKDLTLKNPYPGYQLSTDGKTLAIYDHYDNKVYARFLDLNSNTTRAQGSFYLDGISLTLDLKGAYGQIYSHSGSKGNENWQAYKKYFAWYYPVNTEVAKKQWSDEFYILGMRNDGMFVVASSVKIKPNKKSAYPDMILSDINILDPATGQIKENVRKGDVVEASVEWFTKIQPALFNNGELLVWPHWNKGWNVMNLKSGKLSYVHIPFSFPEVSGKYVMSAKMISLETGRSQARRIVSDMETGAVIDDKIIPLQDAMGIWCTASGSNTFYTLKGSDAKLYKEEVVDGKLHTSDSVQLDINGLFRLNYILGPETSSYQLLVSPQMNRVLFVPRTWDQWNAHGSNLYMWDLSDGKLLFKVENVIQPPADFLAKNNYVPKIAATPVKLSPGLMVMANDNMLYQIIEQRPDRLWSAIQFFKNSNGTYTRYQQDRTEFDLTYNARVITPITCPQCNGGGSVTSVNNRTIEKTDKMIYNQITTTKTVQESTTDACSVCKGLGFSFSN